MSNSSDLPIIGQSSINPDASQDIQPEDIPMRMYQKAFVVYLDEEGRWKASADTMTPTETFQNITAEDVMQGCQRVREELRDQEKASTQVNVNMQLARQMQQQAENQQIMQGLDLKSSR